MGLLFPISTKCTVITSLIMARESFRYIFFSLNFGLLFRQMFKLKAVLHFHYEISESFQAPWCATIGHTPSFYPPFCAQRCWLQERVQVPDLVSKPVLCKDRVQLDRVRHVLLWLCQTSCLLSPLPGHRSVFFEGECFRQELAEPYPAAV